ncbi:hypothetical protein [Pseudoalteromonas denitrificans]|uniref:Uncharacterized protein n=1 Tax=Pseudoalteromonas denitrificans DSM 6059 TaxID=1123010 RepID=A0A1I1UFD9_9GAMM|nr:hypothetical protein [Pseudoalteromonas denitrificans]SFD66670.1 hypothetical protein SAMN02745724_05134 [Pseudoalteromonas denitrificans DSM 6059]
MKLKLNKKKIKNLSKDKNALPADMTNKIAGGWVITRRCTATCP